MVGVKDVRAALLLRIGVSLCQYVFHKGHPLKILENESNFIILERCYPLKILENQSNFHVRRGVQLTLDLSAGGVCLGW